MIGKRRVWNFPTVSGDIVYRAYAVTVDATGRVFANEIQTDTVAMLDPKTEQFQVFKLPSRNVGIRKAIVDAQGRYWYMGSHNGKLGVIE